MINIRLVLASLVMVGLCGCSSLEKEANPEEATSPEQNNVKILDRMNNINMDISRMTEQGSCTSDTQCRTIGIGSKPCGGARLYLPYSTVDTNVTALMDSVAEYNKLDKSRTLSATESADCRLMNDPGARCIASKCVLGGAQ